MNLSIEIWMVETGTMVSETVHKEVYKEIQQSDFEVLFTYRISYPLTSRKENRTD